MMLEDQTEEVMMKEVEETENYRNKISLAFVRIADIVDTKSSETGSVASDTTVRSVNNNSKTRYKLPKIEVKKFNAELIESEFLIAIRKDTP